MFGIGSTELIVIGVVLLIVVGPTKLPAMIKAGVKGYREFRRATRELRASTGIDEILQDEDLKDLRRPLYVPPAKKPIPAAVPAESKGAAKTVPRPVGKSVLSYTERLEEQPPEGVDVAEARDAMHRPPPEEAARVRAEKQAIVDAKLAAARGPVDEDEARRIVDAKLAAAELEAADPSVGPADED